MKNYIVQILVLILVTLTVFPAVNAQESTNRQKEIGITFGLSKVKSFDDRYSARVKTFNAPTFGFFSKSITDNYRHDFVFNYTLRLKVGANPILDYRTNRPDFYYSLQRKTEFGWIGGHINLSNILTFPAIRSGHYNNAPISYTIAASLGPSISFDQSLGGSPKWNVAGDIHASLINYVIRPSYGHPYPDDFLESGVFTPTREGMAPKLLTSGKIRTIDKYQSIKVKFGLYYLVDSKFKMGITGTVDYVNYDDTKPVSFMNSTMSVSASYIY